MKTLQIEATPKFIKIKAITNSSSDIEYEFIINVNDISGYNIDTYVLILQSRDVLTVQDKDSRSIIENYLNSNLI